MLYYNDEHYFTFVRIQCQLPLFGSSCLRSFCNNMLSVTCPNLHHNFVSSANMLISLLIQRGKLLTNNKNNRSPEREPWQNH